MTLGYLRSDVVLGVEKLKFKVRVRVRVTVRIQQCAVGSNSVSVF